MAKADLVIIGAGPAGMAAAVEAAERGLSVVILDEQRHPGGQIYRSVDFASDSQSKILGRDFTYGRKLTGALKHRDIRHIGGAIVWRIETGVQIVYTLDGSAERVRGKRLLIATGAIERAMPIPGWMLPGVMTVGAAQILLKQSRMVFEHAVLVGCGPLLYLLAAQMCRAGTPPGALVETQLPTDWLASFRYVFGAVRGWKYLAKGLGLLAEIKSAGVKRYVGATQIAITGTTEAEAVQFTVKGRQHRIESNAIFLHNGVVPNTQAARSVGISHHWDERQKAFVPDVDGWGRSRLGDIFIAGDGAGIGGAGAAEIAGRLSAIEISYDLGAISKARRDKSVRKLRRRLSAELAVRPFIDRAYPPYPPALSPADETVICRCEEVTAGDIRRFARLGCIGPNQAKAFGRQGMGPCQGRYCGLTVSALLATENNQTLDQTGYYRIRPPIKPVTLQELAGLAQMNKEEIL